MPQQRIQYGPPSMDKALGALPVVAEFCRRLDIAGIVDRACPVREVAILTHGAVIEALVANRLTSPQPLVHVEGWARAWAVGEIFGIDASALNDDRIGRALDAVAPKLEGIVGSLIYLPLFSAALVAADIPGYDFARCEVWSRAAQQPGSHPPGVVRVHAHPTPERLHRQHHVSL